MVRLILSPVALTIDQRRLIFAAVVEAQDRNGGDVELARLEVAQRFQCTEGDVFAIENEGLAADWPLPGLG